MKKTLVVFILAFLAFNIKAVEKKGVDEHILQIKKEQQEAVDKGDIAKLKEISQQLERLSTFGEKEWLVNYYLALSYYRIGTIAEDKEVREEYIELAKEKIRKSVKDKDDFAESHALYSSILGMEIEFKPHLGMTNGMKSGKEIEKAKKLAPGNPRVYMFEGTNKLYTPKIFGGGVNKAIELFGKSAELFKKEENRGVLPDWGGDEVYVWLGKAYEKKEKDSIAVEFYKKALEVNPDCGWAKEILRENEQN